MGGGGFVEKVAFESEVHTWHWWSERWTGADRMRRLKPGFRLRNARFSVNEND